MKSFPIIAFALVLDLCAVAALAKQNPSGLHYWSSDESVFNEGQTKAQASAHGTRSNKRQVAFLMPAPIRLNPVTTPPLSAVRLKAAVSASALKPSATFPTNFDQAADACIALAKNVGNLSTDKALEVGRWIGVFVKQMNSAPVLTPMGLPYADRGEVTATQRHLFLTSEGRIKTVVER